MGRIFSSRWEVDKANTARSLAFLTCTYLSVGTRRLINKAPASPSCCSHVNLASHQAPIHEAAFSVV